MKLTIDTFDFKKLVSIIIEILKRKNIKSINVNYFDFSIDDEINKNIFLEKLYDFLYEIYDEEQYFYFEISGLNVNFDSNEFVLEGKEEYLEKFKDHTS